MCGSGGGEETCALRGVRMLGLQRTRRVSSALFVAHPTSFGSSLLAPIHREWDLTKPDPPEACLFCSELNPQWAPGRGNATDVQTSRHLSTSSISSEQSMWCSFSGCRDFLSALPIVADKRLAFSLRHVTWITSLASRVAPCSREGVSSQQQAVCDADTLLSPGIPRHRGSQRLRAGAQ